MWLTGETGDNLSVGIRKVTDVTFLFIVDGRISPDEINREDVAFLLWAVNSPVGDSFDGVENPLDEDLLKFADVIYNRLDAVFEEALISENLAVDWIMETELMQRKREPLPTAVPGEKLPTNVESLFGGKQGRGINVL